MSIAIGQQARLKQPVVQGEVVDTNFNKTASELEHLISYTDADGELQQRWFLESQLETVDAQ